MICQKLIEMTWDSAGLRHIALIGTHFLYRSSFNTNTTRVVLNIIDLIIIIIIINTKDKLSVHNSDRHC